MVEAQIAQFYHDILGRAPDPAGLAGYSAAARAGRDLGSIRTEITSSDEAIAYRQRLDAQRAQAAQSAKDAADAEAKRIADQKALIDSFTGQIADLKTSFEGTIGRLQTAATEAARASEARYKKLEQQSLEAQTRQGSQQQQAQVASGLGGLKVLRPGGSTRFSRPELQIKSMNI